MGTAIWCEDGPGTWERSARWFANGSVSSTGKRPPLRIGGPPRIWCCSSAGVIGPEADEVEDEVVIVRVRVALSSASIKGGLRIRIEPGKKGVGGSVIGEVG